MFAVRQAMKGYCKGRRTGNSRRPLSLSVLRAILGQLHGSAHPLMNKHCSGQLLAWLFLGPFALANWSSLPKRVARGVDGRGRFLFCFVGQDLDSMDQSGKDMGVELF